MTSAASKPSTMLHRYFLLFAFFVGLSAPSIVPAIAADTVIGSVLALRGDVFRDVGGNRHPLVADAPIYLGDTIVSAVGKAKIALLDGSIVSIGGKTRVRFASVQKSGSSFKERLDLVTGALRLFVAKITSGGQFEVETETAIAAVRGTDWVMEATPRLTSVAVVNGIVAVSGRARPSQRTVVLAAPGQGTDVRRGEPPTAPRRWPRARFEATVARATFE